MFVYTTSKQKLTVKLHTDALKGIQQTKQCVLQRALQIPPGQRK